MAGQPSYGHAMNLIVNNLLYRYIIEMVDTNICFFRKVIFYLIRGNIHRLFQRLQYSRMNPPINFFFHGLLREEGLNKSCEISGTIVLSLSPLFEKFFAEKFLMLPQIPFIRILLRLHVKVFFKNRMQVLDAVIQLVMIDALDFLLMDHIRIPFP